MSQHLEDQTDDLYDIAVDSNGCTNQPTEGGWNNSSTPVGSSIGNYGGNQRIGGATTTTPFDSQRQHTHPHQKDRHDNYEDKLAAKLSAFPSTTTTTTTTTIDSGSTKGKKHNVLNTLDERIASKIAGVTSPSSTSVPYNATQVSERDARMTAKMEQITSVEAAATAAAIVAKSEYYSSRLHQDENVTSSRSTPPLKGDLYADQVDWACNKLMAPTAHSDLGSKTGVEVSKLVSDSIHYNMNGTTKIGKLPNDSTESKDGLDYQQSPGGGKKNKNNLQDGKDPLLHDTDRATKKYDGSSATYDIQTGLAIAVAIHEDEDNELDGCYKEQYLPAAVEFDPDSKDNNALVVETKRRFGYIFCGVITCCIVILGVVVGVIVSATTGSNSHPREELGIREYVQNMVGMEPFLDPKNGYSKAMEWIIYKDPLELTTSDPNLLQRYILAYLYYATSQEFPWQYCAPINETIGVPMDGSKNDNESTSPPPCQLLNYMEETVFDDGDYPPWLGDYDECTWAGISCDSFGHVASIKISGMNMTGSFPEGIAYLPFVNIFEMSLGYLNGSPSSVTKLKHLTYFESCEQRLSDENVLSAWTQTRNLHSLRLAKNNFTGPIPESVEELPDLGVLHLSNNQLIGSIPTTLASLSHLAVINLGGNELTGVIPRRLFSIPKLHLLLLNDNQLEGGLPNQFGSMELWWLDLSRNKLNGTIPTDFYTLTDMYHLRLSGNQFEGEISKKIEDFIILKNLNIDQNQFQGTIPSALGNITYLESFLLHGNQFNGSMPIEVCNSKIKDVEADCLPDSKGVTEIECTPGCCTKCCDSEGTECVSM